MMMQLIILQQIQLKVLVYPFVVSLVYKQFIYAYYTFFFQNRKIPLPVTQAAHSNCLNMGTRGLYGFYYNGKYYIVYNHDDSYYDGLGADLLKELKVQLEKYGNLQLWIHQILQLKSTINRTPTQQDIEKLQKYSDLSVSTKDEKDWYCLLRKCQGSFIKVLDSGYIQTEIVTDFDTIYDYYGGTWIEYVYILNLETSYFEYFARHQIPRFGSSKWHKIKFDDIINDNYKWPPDQIEINKNEKIDESLKYKNYGNELYKDNKFDDAIKHYKISLEWVEYEQFENDEYIKKQKEILIACNNNLCLVYSKLKDWESAIYHATKTLKYDDKNVKALIRRAKAKINSNKFPFKEIKKDLKFAYSLNKNNFEIKKLLKIVNTKEKKQFEQQSKIYMKMFSNNSLNNVNSNDCDQKDIESD